MAVVVGLAWASAESFAQTPPALPQLTETTTVSADESKRIAKVIGVLRTHDDAFIATTVAGSILRLATAMAQHRGTVYLIGPLTPGEAQVINLDRLLVAHTQEEGDISVQVRPAAAGPEPEIFRFSRASFLEFCADLARRGVFLRTPIQKARAIVLGRFIEDINTQIGGVIPEGEILAGLLKGFEAKDHGLITGPLLAITDALARTPAIYDLVPPDKEDAFERVMSVMPFTRVPEAREGHINVRYKGALYASTPKNFVFFFLRFLSRGEPGDPATEHTIRLGAALLKYLESQIR